MSENSRYLESTEKGREKAAKIAQKSYQKKVLGKWEKLQKKHKKYVEKREKKGY